ncbi:hypothetical protein [Archangium lipolyticum]|uniref:hypothetical protein n=1 Tax=Archangium lipolyticum TaxID=2970465 RepID=UPI00214A0B8E|nr:hypothetical protein [Archangium lipolyticum]
MHPLSLVIFLTLAAGPDRPIPAGCREDYRTCREDCTIDYGASTKKYRQLTQCLVGCDKEQKECSSQHYSLQDAQIDPMPARQPDPAMREAEPYEDPDKSSTVPASSTQTSGDAVRRGVYRASEEESTEPILPAPKAEPVAAPEPKAEPSPTAPAKTASEPATSGSEEVPIFDKDEPEPAPKPAEPVRPTPPPPPKKKDISEWDPNGD